MAQSYLDTMANGFGALILMMLLFAVVGVFAVADQGPRGPGALRRPTQLWVDSVPGPSVLEVRVEWVGRFRHTQITSAFRWATPRGREQNVNFMERMDGHASHIELQLVPADVSDIIRLTVNDPGAASAFPRTFSVRGHAGNREFEVTCRMPVLQKGREIARIVLATAKHLAPVACDAD